MGSEGVPYAAARDFERAVVARVASAAASSPYGVPAALVFLLAERFSITKKVGMYKAQELRRQFAFGRLLARVFIHDPDRWVLKGATGLLARLPGQARHSVDVDLYFGGELDAALDALREIADVELGDYFTFDLERGPNLAGVTAGGQLRVTAYLGDKVFERFRIDVVVTHAMTSEPDQVSPIDPVNIPGLRTVDYRTHPIPDQIADKSAAMLATYAGRPSTRYRDLEGAVT